MSAEPAGCDLSQLISPEAVREALGCLYANVELANSQLAKCGLFVPVEAGAIERAQTLRNLLLGAIEALRPLRPAPGYARTEGRSYEILTLRYVAGYTVPEVADQLALGTRQVYRDLRHAEEEMIDALIPQVTRNPTSVQLKPMGLQDEVGVLASTEQNVDLVAIVRDALTILQPLVNQKGLVLHHVGLTGAAWVPLAPGVAREILIQLLSAVIQQAAVGENVMVQVTVPNSCVEIRVRLSGQWLDSQQSLLSDALRTARLLGLSAELRASSSSELILSAATLVLQPLLIVEDNPGARALYERYLEGSRWRVVTLTRLSQVAETAVALRPAAIVLDILMSEVDGWSILQTLKSDPRIAEIPVIVCSVIRDPELARALGASTSLTKPFSRLELVQALERVTSSRNTA
jgi:CheY-like chemotaxis protein